MEDLTLELKRLIDRRVNDRTVTLNEYKDKYDDLEWRLRDLIDQAKALKEDCDRNDLTASTIEAEGFLRFALTVENLL